VRHEFHPEAAAEFEEAVRFYKERGRNLGKRLAREVKTTIRKIVATPDRWRVLEEDVRRCLVRVFPYSVLYTIEADYILIIAVAHGKRQPGYWRHRLAYRPPR
jgi:plasmid stabilization system protein ParE